MIATLLFDFWNVFAYESNVGNTISLNEELIDFVKNQSVPSYVFSNTPSIFLNQFKKDLIPPMTAMYSAKDLGLSKSDPNSYARIAQIIQAEPSEILFCDDQLHNIETARQAGLQTVLFDSTHQCIRDISKQLI
jgi:HAD superfamily hydrolase (TIGR01509 family)